MNDSLETLLEKSKKLYDDKKYKDIILLLEDAILELKNNSELYSYRAVAHSNIDELDISMRYAQKAIELDKTNWMAYFLRAQGRFIRAEYPAALEDLDTAIELNPNEALNYNLRGIVHRRLLAYDKAIEDFNKAIELKPEFSNAILNRAVTWGYIGNYDKANIDFQKSITLQKDNWNVYYSRMLMNFKLSKYKEAIKDSTKAIQLKSDFSLVYFFRAESLRELGQINKAIRDYNDFIKIDKNKNKYHVELVKSKLSELYTLKGDNGLLKIADLVKRIKKILLFENGKIIHYTSLSVAQKLILEKAVFRISEGTFLNDTAEGKELIKYLNIKDLYSNSSDNQSEIFVQKPFIGSFVKESMNDNLNLWRMYGKENFEEAKGCAITIQAESFISLIHDKIDGLIERALLDNEDINFYYVAYLDPLDNKFYSQSIENIKLSELNETMETLKNEVQTYISSNIFDFTDLEGYLNQIAYLFKSENYMSENELRLVVSGVGFDKEISKPNEPPKVFIELTNLSKIITNITLGPKVNHKEEWAAAFYYSFDIISNPVEIQISKLPFK